MPETVIYEDKISHAETALVESGNLWLSARDTQLASGWELKPQGLCKGERCVPIPPGRDKEFVRTGGMINLSALAQQLGAPVVHDDEYATWLFGEAAEAQRSRLLSLEAPDFTLPDLDGKLHSLSDFFGRKILLLSWASW
jgi:hypothetical protein